MISLVTGKHLLGKVTLMEGIALKCSDSVCNKSNLLPLAMLVMENLGVMFVGVFVLLYISNMVFERIEVR